MATSAPPMALKPAVNKSAGRSSFAAIGPSKYVIAFVYSDWVSTLSFGPPLLRSTGIPAPPVPPPTPAPELALPPDCPAPPAPLWLASPELEQASEQRPTRPRTENARYGRARG